MYRNKPKARTVTENSTFEDYMKIQQVDNNGRTNIGQKESEDAWRSVLAAGTDQEPEYVSGPRPIGTLTAEATDDSGRTIPGSAADNKSKKTIGKFRSQPGAGPGQAERNAKAKEEENPRKVGQIGEAGVQRAKRAADANPSPENVERLKKKEASQQRRAVATASNPDTDLATAVRAGDAIKKKPEGATS